MTVRYITDIMVFLGGLGMFIFGMKIMSNGLQKSAGTKMKQLLEMLTKSKLMGIIVGMIVTGIIQSSTATTVMVVGFVNAGLMNLTQSVGIILGANIGTTFTAWIVASAEWLEYLNPVFLAPIAIFIGVAMIIVAKSDKTRSIGEIITGFGILFMGMATMSSALHGYRASPFWSDLFVALGSNPLLGIFAGILVTSVIQSSTASIAILQSLALAGLVPWNAAVYIIIGQNVGTCLTAILSSLGASKNAKAAAFIHLLYNVAGAAVVGTLSVIYFYFINSSFGSSLVTATSISAFHSGYNVAILIIFYPFTNALVYFAKKFVKAEDTEEEDITLLHLDDRILETPGFAVESFKKEIIRLSKITMENFLLAAESLFDRDEAKIDKVFKREQNIDILSQSITLYLVKLCNSNISKREYNLITPMFHIIHDIERIGDHSENLAELAQFAAAEDVNLSPAAHTELIEIIKHTESSLENCISALESEKAGNLECLMKAEELEDELDIMEERLRASHIKRLTSGECIPTAGVFFLDVLSNLERVGDHAINIVQAVELGYAKKKG